MATTTATGKRREYRLVLEVERVNQLKVEATARGIAEGRPVTWAELARELIGNKKGVGRGDA